ncbi:MAG: hypothetical protein GY865_18320 [candidate division Zixibacteria bacterium]|nr:hypothetical protein [candidate division Zixibacteria bacterium]
MKLFQYIILVLFCAVFVVNVVSNSFTQDDAYISYRYVKNFINGDGLTFNPGEQVEGYTSLFFILLLSLLGRFGIDIIIASKVIGIISGIGLIFLSFLWCSKLPDFKENIYLPLAVPFLLVCNGAFAYWSISGMETVLFAVLILYGSYLASNKNLLFVPILAIATLTRPEGGLIFVTILVFFTYSKQFGIKDIVKFLALFLIFIVPQFIFRFVYYNDILPNPFYAKTGSSIEYLISGIEYVWLFMTHYGLYGGILLIPLFAAKYLPRPLRLILSVAVVFCAYILLVGGDVLHCFRFFIPILALFYMLLVYSLVYLARNSEIFKHKNYNSVIITIILIIGIYSYFIPAEHIKGFLTAERGLVNKMTHLAFILDPHAKSHNKIACTTIGAFSYYSDAYVIDMLGLTDRHIAKNPQTIANIRSNWKERNYNIPYIMKSDPDFIIFSTNMKPSAPAEKALFLSSKFRQGYYPVFGAGVEMKVIYKRRPDFSGEDIYFPDPLFVDLFAEAINRNNRREYDDAFEMAFQSIIKGPPDFYLPLSILGQIELEFGEPKDGVTFFKEAIKRSNGYATISANYLARYYEVTGDSTLAKEINLNQIKVNRLD